MSTDSLPTAEWTPGQLLRTVVLGAGVVDGIEIIPDHADAAELETDLELLTGWREHQCHIDWDICPICADWTMAGDYTDD